MVPNGVINSRFCSFSVQLVYSLFCDRLFSILLQFNFALWCVCILWDAQTLDSLPVWRHTLGIWSDALGSHDSTFDLYVHLPENLSLHLAWTHCGAWTPGSGLPRYCFSIISKSLLCSGWLNFLLFRRYFLPFTVYLKLMVLLLSSVNRICHLLVQALKCSQSSYTTLQHFSLFTHLLNSK